MENINIILWAIGGGFTILFGAFVFGFKILRDDMRMMREDLNKKIDRLDEKMTDVDRRLCRLEGAFASKDFCMLTDHRTREKAE